MYMTQIFREKKFGVHEFLPWREKNVNRHKKWWVNFLERPCVNFTFRELKREKGNDRETSARVTASTRPPHTTSKAGDQQNTTN